MRNQFLITIAIGLTFITTTLFAQNYIGQRPQRMNQGPRMNNYGPQRFQQRSFQNNNTWLKANGMNQHQQQQNRQDFGKTRVYKQQQQNQQQQQNSQSGSVL